MLRGGRIWIGLAAIVAPLYLTGLAVLYVVQRSLVFHPDTARPEVARAGVPGLGAVEVPTEDGLRLLGWYKPAAAGQPTLLYFHGNGGNLGNRIDRVRRFAQTGWGLLFLEYRGYGGNAGAPSEAGLARDARGAADYLARQGVGADRLMLYGESLGTGVAARLASERPVAALVLESPYTSIAAIAQGQFRFVPVGWMMRDPFPLLALLPAIHAPLLVLQGERDQVVPPAMGRAVFAAANPPKQFWAAPLGDHGDLAAYGAEEVVIRFIASTWAKR